ncbi:GNAT family N-acetyltransferase [Undibacterium pigrum]|uniref:Acetyltransferase (GNAT) family protein n=1 Tax=Undibacterium pigrum TaxID=401470 RepID=A0A318IXU0_9BURK|nr:GNAT family N-acetyltransferase [Undibacterium pigrum]PXX35315.1 acetyltransferase (GNAT) family protein [Undibacterium pigrum]
MDHLSTGKVTIRKAEATDVSVLTVLIQQVWLDTYVRQGVSQTIADYVLSELTAARTATYLSQEHTHILLAESIGHLVGYCQTSNGKRNAQVSAEHQAELDHLYIHPAFFGRGIGRQLLTETEAHLRELGVQQVWLTTWIGNDRARHFYPLVGYTDIGETIFRMEAEDIANRIFCKTL